MIQSFIPKGAGKLFTRGKKTKETYAFDIGKIVLLGRVLANDLVRAKIHIDPRVPHARDDIVQTHVQAREQQHAVLHDADLDAVHTNAVVVQLRLEEDDLVEEEDGVAPPEELERDLLVGGRWWWWGSWRVAVGGCL